MKELLTVLIVEDEVINRKILKKLLTDRYNILEACNGEQAWQLLTDHQHTISAVLLDVVMPVLDGFGVLERLRQNHMEDLPVIVMTGHSDSESEQRALDAGAWDFVTKPFNPRVLISRLRNAVARSQVSFYEKMQHMTEHDPLTGLHNRGKMFDNTRKMLASHPEQSFVFVRLDINHFALFNSSFGEEEGDRLICRMARSIEECAAHYPLFTFGRMNADLFCLCVPFDGSQDALTARLLHIQDELAAAREDYQLSLAAGAYIIDDPSLQVEEIFLRASSAAKACKQQHENVLLFYDADDGKRVANEAVITREMQTALDQEQFVVYFQPKFKLATDTANGAEALVRWQHPERGLVPPGDFIPVFERNGFIAKLDYYIWEHTCRWLRRWLDAGRKPDPISVNISRVSLYNPHLVSLLTELVGRYSLPPALLQLEVTESAIMTSPELMQATVHQLRLAGFTILMDDFGSGYSSLNTLKTMEVDILKIDMKFLPVGSDTEKGEIILASIIRMANWLGMGVVVEGVETRKQRDFFEGTGCDCVQGYFYSRPIPAEEYEQKYVCAEPAVQKAPPETNLPAEVHSNTLLIIDDQETDRAILNEYFKNRYHIHLCDSAGAGLAYLQHYKNSVRLILVDNLMPGMSGLDFLTYCQSVPSLRSIPQIIITAATSTKDQVEAFRLGAYDYIAKPLVKELVIARVNHVMDISYQYRAVEEAEQEYKRRAQRDPATDLLTKTAFQDLCMHALQHAERNAMALMVLDLDHFKEINDRFGHLTGDQVLLCVAQALQRVFRQSDLLGRFGGDEFVVLLADQQNVEGVRRKAADLMKAVAASSMQLFHIGISLSVGIAFCTEDDTPQTLFARADQALYEAKSTGRAKAVIYGEHVPPILDDDKPVVLICGDDPQLFPAIALAYGSSAAFAGIGSMEALRAAFARYSSRIRAVCIDLQKQSMDRSGEFLGLIKAQGGGTTIPLLAVCREGDMAHLRTALTLGVQDVITLPPQMDLIQRRISQAIVSGCAPAETPTS